MLIRICWWRIAKEFGLLIAQNEVGTLFAFHFDRRFTPEANSKQKHKVYYAKNETEIPTPLGRCRLGVCGRGRTKVAVTSAAIRATTGARSRVI